MSSGRCAVRTSTLVGVRAVPVDVEIDVGAGLPSFSIVGLGDLAVHEAKERVRSALRASGFELPNARIVVNLAPGPLRKHGTGFDLPIAVGLLVATRQLPASLSEIAVWVGELSLDGRVRRVPGMLAHTLACLEDGTTLIGPAEAVASCAVAHAVFRPIRRLADLRQGAPEVLGPSAREDLARSAEGADFADVVGQDLAVTGLVAAAAGGHHVLMVGPPGSGKTMLARRLSTILPPLSDTERLDTALVHSVAGLDESQALAGIRPFRAPHHSASIAGLVGGGSPPRPGEASLAHNGVLFLDEMPEFGPAALQCLRQPLEDGVLTVVRAEGRVTFPASFMLVGAANPCPCGFLGDRERRCTCPDAHVQRYQGRIGGPLMDRLDIVLDVARPDPSALVRGSRSTESRVLRDRVLAAREFAASTGRRLGPVSGAELLDACRLEAKAVRFLEHQARATLLSGRGITRLLRVARTFADLESRPRVSEADIALASTFRDTRTTR